MQPALLPGENRLHDMPPEKVMWLHVFARLKPGVTAGRAAEEANAIFHAGLESFYGGVPADAERRRRYFDQRLVLRPGGRGASETRGDFSTAVSALMAAVGLLLLIACANLANLLLARGAARRAEMSLRLSLGASRGRLVRQLLTESFVLAVAGGVASLLAAAAIYAALAGMIARSDPNFQLPFALVLGVLAFTAGVTILAALLFGALPAWQITRSEAGAGLREQARGAVGRSRWGRGLVALQLALSLPLLIGAGLLARTVYNLGHEDLGYSTDHLSIVSTNSRAAGYDTARSRTLFLALVAQIRAIPGVQAVTVSHNGLFTGGNSGDPVIVEG
jgi:hypothetical protein